MNGSLRPFQCEVCICSTLPMSGVRPNFLPEIDSGSHLDFGSLRRTREHVRYTYWEACTCEYGISRITVQELCFSISGDKLSEKYSMILLFFCYATLRLRQKLTLISPLSTTVYIPDSNDTGQCMYCSLRSSHRISCPTLSCTTLLPFDHARRFRSTISKRQICEGRSFELGRVYQRLLSRKGPRADNESPSPPLKSTLFSSYRPSPGNGTLCKPAYCGST